MLTKMTKLSNEDFLRIRVHFEDILRTIVRT